MNKALQSLNLPLDTRTQWALIKREKNEKTMLEQFAAWLGVKKVSLLGAALVGSAISALRAKHLSIGARIATFFGGFGASVYLTNPVSDWLGMVGDANVHGVAFVLGLIGMTLIEAVATLDWKGIIQRRVESENKNTRHDG